MNRCIICNEVISKKSIEHIIPDAIGGTWTMTLVCEACNKVLGNRVDYPLVSNSLIMCLRMRFHVKNRDGKEIDPFRSFKFSDLEGNETIIKKKRDGKTQAYYDGTQKPSVAIEEKQDGGLSVKFTGSDMESILTKAKREAGRLEIYGKDGIIAQAILDNTKLETGYTFARTPIEINYEAYAPCIVKIAYESAVFQLGEEYLNDSIGKALQEYLQIYCGLKECCQFNTGTEEFNRLIMQFLIQFSLLKSEYLYPKMHRAKKSLSILVRIVLFKKPSPIITLNISWGFAMPVPLE